MANVMIKRPLPRPHYASCPSVRLSHADSGLLTPKQKGVLKNENLCERFPVQKYRWRVNFNSKGQKVRNSVSG